jgi:hypothetical protein
VILEIRPRKWVVLEPEMREVAGAFSLDRNEQIRGTEYPVSLSFIGGPGADLRALSSAAAQSCAAAAGAPAVIAAPQQHF